MVTTDEIRAYIFLGQFKSSLNCSCGTRNESAPRDKPSTNQKNKRLGLLIRLTPFLEKGNCPTFISGKKNQRLHSTSNPQGYQIPLAQVLIMCTMKDSIISTRIISNSFQVENVSYSVFNHKDQVHFYTVLE